MSLLGKMIPIVQFDFLGGIFSQIPGFNPTWFLKFDTDLDNTFQNDWGP
jgi:hypothetical protein